MVQRRTVCALTAGALFAVLPTIDVALAGCEPYSAFDSPPATEVERLQCKPGLQRHREWEVLNLDKAGSGRVRISVLILTQGDERQAAMLFRVGPYGKYDTKRRLFIDADETPGLIKFLKASISHLAKRAPPVTETGRYAHSGRASTAYGSSADRSIARWLWPCPTPWCNGEGPAQLK